MRYVSIPTECEAMQWWDSQHGLLASASQIVTWVNANGGEARYEPRVEAPPDGARAYYQEARIAVRTINGWAYATPDWFVVMGSETFPASIQHESRRLRDFYPVPNLSQVRHVKHEWVAASEERS